MPNEYEVMQQTICKQELMNSYSTHQTTPLNLAAMRTHLEPYSVSVFGKDLVVHPGVFSPLYDWSGTFHVECLPNLDGRDFLEIGSGSGIVSVFACCKGARTVTAVDINRAAVANTKENLSRHCTKQFSVLESDVFSAVDGRFDLVLFNAPYHGNKPKDMLEMAVSDENYGALRRFLRDVHLHLRPTGLVVLGFSQSGDKQLLFQLLHENGMAINDLRSDWRKGYNCEVYCISVNEEALSE